MFLFAANAVPGFVLVIQMLNGLTFALTWVADVAHANKHAPPGLSTTSQGIFGAMVNGIGLAVDGFIGGPLLERLGGRGLYLVLGITVLAILMAVALTQLALDKRIRTAR